MRPSDIATGWFIFGPTSTAFRYAEELWRTLPRLNRAQAYVLAKALQAAFGGWSPPPNEVKCMNLRRPHFTACRNGIFGGGATCFPGEFALANYGVLLFAEIGLFKPEIIAGLAEKLEKRPQDGFPIVLLHAAEPSDIPASLASLAYPRVDL